MALRGRGSYNVGFEFHGSWFKFNNIINSTDVLMVMGARQAQKEFAIQYRDQVKANILNGGRKFGYPPLSENYLIYKLRRGGPGSALVWSKAFYNAVEIKKNNTGTRYMVGIPKGAQRDSYYPKDKVQLSIAEYANVLEHGTKNLEARPIFADTFKHDMGGITGLKVFTELTLIRLFGSSGIKVNR